MLKLYIALGLALFVALLTAIVGLVEGARPLTLLFRTFVSLAVFGVCGYLLGRAAEGWMAHQAAEVKPKGRNIDITSEDSLHDDDELLSPSHVNQPFSPFSPDKFERISVKE